MLTNVWLIDTTPQPRFPRGNDIYIIAEDATQALNWYCENYNRSIEHVKIMNSSPCRAFLIGTNKR